MIEIYLYCRLKLNIKLIYYYRDHASTEYV